MNDVQMVCGEIQHNKMKHHRIFFLVPGYFEKTTVTMIWGHWCPRKSLQEALEEENFNMHAYFE